MIVNKCKGLIYRAHVNEYYKDGMFRKDVRLKLLKRRSCKGCQACGVLLDTVQEEYREGLYLDMTGVEPYSAYQLKLQWSPSYSSFEYDGEPELYLYKVEG